MSLLAISGRSFNDVKEDKFELDVEFKGESGDLFGEIEKVVSEQLGRVAKLTEKDVGDCKLIKNMDGKFEKTGPNADSSIIARTYKSVGGDDIICFLLNWRIELVDGKIAVCQQTITTPFQMTDSELSSPLLLASQAYRAMMWAKNMRFVIKASLNSAHAAHKSLREHIHLLKASPKLGQKLVSRTNVDLFKEEHVSVLPKYPSYAEIYLSGKLIANRMVHFQNRKLSSDWKQWLKTDETGDQVMELVIKHFVQKIIVVHPKIQRLEALLREPADGFGKVFEQYQKEREGEVKIKEQDEVKKKQKLQRIANEHLNSYCTLLGKRIGTVESYISTLIDAANKIGLKKKIGELEKVKTTEKSAKPLFDKLQKLTEYLRCLTLFWEERNRLVGQCAALGKRIERPKSLFGKNLDETYPAEIKKLAPLAQEATIKLLQDVRGRFKFPPFCIQTCPIALQFDDAEARPFGMNMNFFLDMTDQVRYRKIVEFTIPSITK